MPYVDSGEAKIWYTEQGTGFPMLTLAPGGMSSSVPLWEMAAINPLTAYAGQYQMIAMDQRNAGKSSAPITASDGWETYTGDHIALLDHLAIKQCHLMGGCIGGSYSLGVIKAAPDRVSAAVLQNPIGLSPRNREMFYNMFDTWADGFKVKRNLDDASLRQFRDRMYGTDFVFNVSRDFVRSCKTPMLILCGNDDYHPKETSKEIAALAPNAELVEHWKAPEAISATVKRVREFLISHTPKS